MAVSTEDLLRTLRESSTGTEELAAALNALQAKKKGLQAVPVDYFRVCTSVLAVACADAKWPLMDTQMQQACAQLLASYVGLEIVVRNVKNGLDMLQDGATPHHGADITIALDLSGTGYTRPEERKSGNEELKATSSSPESTFVIKETSTTHLQGKKPQSAPIDSQLTPSQGLQLVASKSTTTIQFDILLAILNHLEDVVHEFLSIENTVGARFREFRGLLSVKISEVFGQGLVYVLDNPSGLSVGALEVTREKIKTASQSYSSTLARGLLLGKQSFTVADILCELARRDQFVWTIVLQNWSNVLDSLPMLDSSSRKESAQVRALKTFTTLLFKSNKILSSEANQWIIVVRSWLERLQTIGASRKMLSSVIYNLCKEGSDSTTSFTWISALGSVDVEWVKESISIFGSKPYTENTPLTVQQTYALFIIFMINMLGKQELGEVAQNKLFLNAITARLESKVNETRELGMVVADVVYEREHGKPLFSVSGYDKKKRSLLHTIDHFMSLIKDTMTLENAITGILGKDKTISVAIMEDKIIAKEQPMILELDYDSDADDSDLEDSSVPRRPTVAKPVFLKDLVNYLTCETEKDNKTYYKRGIAFSIGIEMVRLKRNTAELSFYTVKLLDALANLNDFGFPELPADATSGVSRAEAFNTWKISFLIAVIVSSPAAAFQHLFKCFLENDISTPQRVQILSAIGFACRELCGQDKEDVFVWGKHNDQKVQSRLLGVGHEEFKRLDTKIQEVTTDLIKPSEHISSGTVTRKSRKLEIDRENIKSQDQIQSKKIVTTYINKELPKIFYALASIWHEVNSQTGDRGFVVGSMSELINSHYLSILSMVFKCAVPSCIDVVEMSVEMLGIVREQLALLNACRDFQQLIFCSVAKCAGALVLNNAVVIKMLLNTHVVECVDVLNLLTTVMNERGDAVTDLVAVSIGAKVVLELQTILKGEV